MKDTNKTTTETTEITLSEITLSEITLIQNELIKIESRYNKVNFDTNKPFKMVLTLLSGKDRSDYKAIKTSLLDNSNFNSYSKGIINKAFLYKELKIISITDLLSYDTIKKLIASVKNTQLTTDEIKKAYKKDILKDTYNARIEKLFENMPKLENNFNVEKEIKRLGNAHLSNEDKQKLIDFLTK